MDSEELEKTILERPLPSRVLLRSRNLKFLLEGVGAAFRIFVLLPFRRVETFHPPAPPGAVREADLEWAAISHALAEKLLRSPWFPFRRTCLRRSLLLAHLLRKSGIEVSICFGVSRGEGDLRGHSWLAVDGTPFLENEESWRGYTCVFTLPRAD
ncbi:MAG: lasso peptide biosynthesis B2 protein [Candidatus Eisenbacteria bacterium]